ncbi:MAG: hypothetical protein RLZZ148_1853 [Cyanobacteriota bacterium]|jgi:hypothetical protein
MAKRKAILLAIKAKLETLTGFESVFYWHDFATEYEKDVIEFRDLEERSQQVNIPFSQNLMIRVRAIKFTEDTLEIGEDTLDDLKALFADELWGGNAHKTSLTSSRKIVKTSGKKSVTVEIYLSISYREDL